MAMAPFADAVAPVERAEIVDLNGQKFVAGLFWKPLEHPRRYMTEAREFGRARNWDIVAIRRSLHIQAGFVKKNAGVTKGMYSLAAALAGQFGSDWIGAFALPNGRYAVVGVHEGAIVPGYDQICAYDEAVQLVREGYQDFNLKADQIFAPADFGLPATELDILQLLQPKRLKKDYRLKQLTFGLSRKEVLTLLLIAGVALGGLYGFKRYSAWRAAQAHLDQLRRAAALQLLNAHSKHPLTLAALAHPWAQAATPAMFSRTCAAALGRLPLVWGGWTFQQADCDGKQLQVIYGGQPPATVAQFLAAVGPQWVPQMAPDQERGQLTLPLNLPLGGDEALLASTPLLTAFFSYFQGLSVPVRLVPQPAPPGPANAPVPTWRSWTFSLETAIPPAVLLLALPVQTGVRVSHIKTLLNPSTASLNWSVEGELYARK